MDVGRVKWTLIITALMVLTGQQNGFVSASTSSTATTMPMTTTLMQSTTNATANGTNEMSSSPSSASVANPMTSSPTHTIQPTTVTTQSAAPTTTTTKNPPDMTTVEQRDKASSKKFHTIMIVMIVVLAFIIIFSVSCGLCVICDIDIGCPIPCCGGGGKAANHPAGSSAGMKLKRSSRPDRISSHRLHDAEEFQEVECKGIKGHGSEYGQDNITYYEF